MAEHFLEEQVQRIREMIERMAHIRDRSAEFSAEFERDRANARRGPLQEVRDLRTYSSFRQDDHDRRSDNDGARHSSRAAARRRRK